MSTQTSTRNSCLYIIIAALLFYAVAACFTPPVCLGEDLKGKVVILNSDSSVEKYNIVEESFSSSLNLQKVKIKLDDSLNDDEHVANTVEKESPDVVFSIGTKAYMSAFNLPGEKKHVFTGVLNWMRLPTNDNTYGISDSVPQAAQLNMFHYFFPELKTIAILYNEVYNQSWVDLAVDESKNVSIKIVPIDVSHPEDVEAALKEMLTQADALWLIPDPVIFNTSQSVDLIFKTCSVARKPIFTYSPVYLKDGAMFIITADIPTTGRQSAELVKELLRKGKAPMKVQDPAGTFILLNQKKALEYGMKLNEEALSMASQVIE